MIKRLNKRKLLSYLMLSITFSACFSVIISMEFINLILNLNFNLTTLIVTDSFCISILIYWIVKKHTSRLNFVERFSLCNMISVFALLSFNIASSSLDYYKGEDQYSYKYGHYFGPIRIIAKNPLGQWTLEQAYSSLALKEQQILKMVEETARAYRIHQDFSSKGLLNPSFCRVSSKYLCFRNVLSSVFNSSISDYSGIMLLNQIGQNYLEYMPTSSGFNKSLEAEYKMYKIDLEILIHKEILKSGRVSQSLSHFPQRAIASLSSIDIKRIRGVMHSSTKKKYDSYQRLIKKNQVNKEMFNEASPDEIAEALVLEEIDNRKILRHFIMSGQNLVELLGDIKIDSKYCKVNKCEERLNNYRKDFFVIQKIYADLGILI